MYYNPLKKKQIDVVVSRASSYSLLASLLLSLNLKIKIIGGLNLMSINYLIIIVTKCTFYI